MLELAGPSLALFAVVWSLMGLVSGALVTDTMLRNIPAASLFDTDRAATDA